MPGFASLADSEIVNELMIGENDGIYRCSICNFSSTIRSNVKRHIRGQHGAIIEARLNPVLPEVPLHDEPVQPIVPDNTDDSDDEQLEYEKKKAEVVLKTLKARFPLSDAFLLEFFKALKLGVDFNLIENPKDLLSLADPTTVKSVNYCVTCNDKVEKECNKLECFEGIQSVGRADVRYQIEKILADSAHHFDWDRPCDEDVIRDITDGSSHKELVRLLHLDHPGAENVWITFTLNTDGVRLYSSPPSSFWPLYLFINQIKPSKRFLMRNVVLHSIWQGPSKSVPFGAIMTDLRDQLNELNAEGVQIVVQGVPRIARFVVSDLTADLQARAPLSGIKGPTSYNACLFCETTAESCATENGGYVRGFGAIVEETDEEPLRTATSVIRCAELAAENNEGAIGIVGKAPCDILPYVITPVSWTIDSMHGSFLGVAEDVANLWFSSEHHEMECYIPPAKQGDIAVKLKEIKLPAFLTHLPRTMKRDSWKASDWRSWTLHLSLPLLQGLLKPRYLKNWALFVHICHVISLEEITEIDLASLRLAVGKFVSGFKELYGVRRMSLNVHNILHWPTIISRWGPAWAYSNFNPESLNGWIRRRCYGTGWMIAKAATRFIQAKILVHEIEQLNDSTIKDYCFRNLSIPVSRTQNAGKSWTISDKAMLDQINVPELVNFLELRHPICQNHVHKSANRVKFLGFLVWTRRYLKPKKTQGYYVSLSATNMFIFAEVLEFLHCATCNKLFLLVEEYYNTQPLIEECGYVHWSSTDSGHRRTIYDADTVKVGRIAHLRLGNKHFFSKNCATFEGS